MIKIKVDVNCPTDLDAAEALRFAAQKVSEGFKIIGLGTDVNEGYCEVTEVEYLDVQPIDRMWIIWSNEHCAWWGPNRAGYVRKRQDAGRYSFTEAVEIVRRADFAPEARDIPNETMMLDLPKP